MKNIEDIVGAISISAVAIVALLSIKSCGMNYNRVTCFEKTKSELCLKAR